AVEAVGDEEDHGAPAEDSPRPGAIEFGEAAAEAGATRPVEDLAAAAGQGLVGIAAFEDPRRMRQPGGEEEDLEAPAVVGERVEEVEQHLRVTPHGARDVAQDDQGRRQEDPGAELE